MSNKGMNKPNGFALRFKGGEYLKVTKEGYSFKKDSGNASFFRFGKGTDIVISELLKDAKIPEEHFDRIPVTLNGYS